MNYRQKTNGIWFVDYEDDAGKRRRVSTGIKTAPSRTPPADVKAAGREIVLGLREPSTFSLPSAQKAHKTDGRLTMSGLFDKCEATVWHPDNARAQRTIRSNLKILRALIGDVAVEDMTFQRLQDLVQELKGKDYAPATIKRKLDMVSKALRMATMWADDAGRPLLGYKPPMPRIAVNNLKDRIIAPVEEEALFAAAEKRRQTEPNRQWFKFIALLEVLFDTAGRLGETINLGPNAIARQPVGDREVSFLTFPRYRTKNGKPRTLPLTARAVAAFGRLMDQLVLDRETGEWRFFGMTTGTAWYMFNQLREDVKAETGMDLSGVTLHTIRHTTATRLARGGMDLARLQEWLGHSDPKITAERYLHLIPSDLVRGLSILGSVPALGDISTRDHDKPVIVPDTTPAAIGARPGTVRLQ